MNKVKNSGQVYPDFLSLYTLDSDDEYVPEIILDERVKGTSVQYLVKFKDYGMRENQWLNKKKLTNYPDVLDTWMFEKSSRPRKLTRLQRLEDKKEEDKNTCSPQHTYDDIQEEEVRHRLKKNTEELSFDNTETAKNDKIEKQTKKQMLTSNLYPEYSKIYKILIKQIQESKDFVEIIKKNKLLSLQ